MVDVPSMMPEYNDASVNFGAYGSTVSVVRAVFSGANVNSG